MTICERVDKKSRTLFKYVRTCPRTRSNRPKFRYKMNTAVYTIHWYYTSQTFLLWYAATDRKKGTFNKVHKVIIARSPFERSEPFNVSKMGRTRHFDWEHHLESFC